MKKMNNMNKRGFTLVEMVTTTAIIVIMSSITIVGVKDHIRNAERVTEDIDLYHQRLVSIQDGDYSSQFEHNADANTMSLGFNTNRGGDQMTFGDGSNSSYGGSGDAAAAEAAPAEIEVQGTEEAEAEELSDRDIAVQARADEISAYANAHGVNYLPGTENLPMIIAEGEMCAIEAYENGGYDAPRYFEYIPATGEVIVHTNIEQRNGQNLTRNYLNESEARYTTQYTDSQTGNIRGQIDEAFLTNARESNTNYMTSRCDRNHSIYYGINRNADGSLQVVPNICIDTNGNFNTINTYNFGINRASGDRSSVRATDSRNRSWDSYVDFVTTNDGGMLDLSTYTAQSLTSKQNWVAYVNTLRGN